MTVPSPTAPATTGKVPRSRLTLVGVLVIGVLAAVAAPLTPWYALANHVNHFPDENETIALSSTTSFYPGADYRYSCTALPSSAPVWGPLCQATHSMPDGVPQLYADLNALLSTPGTGIPSSSLGALYGAIYYASIAGASVGAVALALSVSALLRGANRRLSFGVALALAVAGAICLGGVIETAAFEAPAFAHDCKGGGVGCLPNSDFWGSCGPTPASCGSPPYGNLTDSTSWGPSLGWYLELGAAALFLGSSAALFWTRRRRQKTVSSGSGEGSVA